VKVHGFQRKGRRKGASIRISVKMKGPWKFSAKERSINKILTEVRDEKEGGARRSSLTADD